MPRSTFKSDTLIDIVLEDGGHFTVQRALLCGASEYFRSALLGEFTEAKDKKLRLPGCSSVIFELLLYWICKNALPKSTHPGCCKGDEAVSCGDRQATLVRLWHTAGMYLMPGLQNAIMRYLFEILDWCWVHPLAMEIAFEMGSGDCPMRSMLLDRFLDDIDNADPPKKTRDYDEIAFSAWSGHPSSGMAQFAQIPGLFDVFVGMVAVSREKSRSVMGFAQRLSEYSVPEELQ